MEIKISINTQNELNIWRKAMWTEGETWGLRDISRFSFLIISRTIKDKNMDFVRLELFCDSAQEPWIQIFLVPFRISSWKLPPPKRFFRTLRVGDRLLKGGTSIKFIKHAGFNNYLDFMQSHNWWLWFIQL